MHVRTHARTHSRTHDGTHSLSLCRPAYQTALQATTARANEPGRPPASAAPSAQVVTSVMSYCGIDIADNGTLILDFRYHTKRCMVVYGTPQRPDPRDSVARRARSFLPALKQQGVRTEIATGSGNCSIASMRTLWRDLTISPRQLLAAVLAAGADGLNIDFEPQANHCQGGAARNHSRAARRGPGMPATHVPACALRRAIDFVCARQAPATSAMRPTRPSSPPG